MDIAAKKIAIKIGKIDARTKQWDLNYRNRTGQQPSGNPSIVNRFLNDANTLGTGVYNFLLEVSRCMVVDEDEDEEDLVVVIAKARAVEAAVCDLMALAVEVYGCDVCEADSR